MKGTIMCSMAIFPPHWVQRPPTLWEGFPPGGHLVSVPCFCRGWFLPLWIISKVGFGCLKNKLKNALLPSILPSSLKGKTNVHFLSKESPLSLGIYWNTCPSKRWWRCSKVFHRAFFMSSLFHLATFSSFGPTTSSVELYRAQIVIQNKFTKQFCVCLDLKTLEVGKLKIFSCP